MGVGLLATSMTRENLQKNDVCTSEEELFFDGRKDKTITQVLGEDKKFHRKTPLEEHITIVIKPEANYFNHTTP